MAKTKEEVTLLDTTQSSETTESKEVKTEAKEKADSKEVTQSSESKSIEDFKNELSVQERKVLTNFMNNSVYDKFMTYLESVFREKDTIVHRINCYCFRVKEDFSIRIHGKFYNFKAKEIFYIQKDSFGNAMLRNSKVERIM